MDLFGWIPREHFLPVCLYLTEKQPSSISPELSSEHFLGNFQYKILLMLNLLTFWYFKWLKLYRLNVVHQVRHLFCGHSLTSSSTLGQRRENTAVFICLWRPAEATNTKAQFSVNRDIFHWSWLSEVSASCRELHTVKKKLCYKI